MCWHGEINLNTLFLEQHNLLRYLKCISHSTCLHSPLHRETFEFGLKKMTILEFRDFYALVFGSTDIESSVREFWASSGVMRAVQENILVSCLISKFFLPYYLATAANLFTGTRHRVTEVVLTFGNRNMHGISRQGGLHTMVANGKTLLCLGLSLCCSCRFHIKHSQRRFNL